MSREGSGDAHSEDVRDLFATSTSAHPERAGLLRFYRHYYDGAAGPTSTAPETHLEFYWLDRDRVGLGTGRKPSVDVKLPEDWLDAASGVHAIFEREADAWRVQCPDPWTSGASKPRLNGDDLQPGTRYRLADGDIITVGTTLFRFCGSETVPIYSDPKAPPSPFVGGPTMRRLMAEAEEAANDPKRGHVLIRCTSGSGADAQAIANRMSQVSGKTLSTIHHDALFLVKGSDNYIPNLSLVPPDVLQKSVLLPLREPAWAGTRLFACGRPEQEYEIVQYFAHALDIPDLAARPEEIPVLLQHALGSVRAVFEIAAVERLCCIARWPGNRKSLEEVVSTVTGALSTGNEPHVVRVEPINSALAKVMARYLPPRSSVPPLRASPSERVTPQAEAPTKAGQAPAPDFSVVELARALVRHRAVTNKQQRNALIRSELKVPETSREPHAVVRRRIACDQGACGNCLACVLNDEARTKTLADGTLADGLGARGLVSLITEVLPDYPSCLVRLGLPRWDRLLVQHCKLDETASSTATDELLSTLLTGSNASNTVRSLAALAGGKPDGETSPLDAWNERIKASSANTRGKIRAALLKVREASATSDEQRGVIDALLDVAGEAG